MKNKFQKMKTAKIIIYNRYTKILCQKLKIANKSNLKAWLKILSSIVFLKESKVMSIKNMMMIKNQKMKKKQRSRKLIKKVFLNK